MDILDVKVADRLELDSIIEKIASYNDFGGEAIDCVIVGKAGIAFQTKQAEAASDGYHSGLVTTDPVPVGVASIEHDLNAKDKYNVYIVDDINNPSFDALSPLGEVELGNEESDICDFVKAELFDVESTARIDCLKEINAIYVLIENTPACMLERIPQLV